jgi:hypothetical protein
MSEFLLRSSQFMLGGAMLGGLKFTKSLKIWLTSIWTRLKGLPVISREHFCKTRTNCYEILPCSIFTSNTKIGTSNTNCNFKYQLLLQIPIVTSTTNCYFEYQNWYFEYQLLLQIPIVTSTTNCYFEYQNWYFEYQLLLQIPIVTSNTNCYFQYQLLLRMPWVTIHQEQDEEQQQQQSGY